MNGFASTLDSSIGLMLTIKWTVVLALAWLAHALLARRNPRWRVALWRTAMVGLLLVAMLSEVPPIVTYRLVPRVQPLIEAVPTVSPVAVRVTPEVSTIGVQPGIAQGRRPSGAEAGQIRSDPPAGVAASEAGKPQGVPRHDSATRKAQGTQWGAGIVSGLWSIWLAGVLVLTARLILAGLSLARLVRRSSEAPEAIVRECREIAARLGCRGPVRAAPDAGNRDALPGWALVSRTAVAGAGM